ncbi:MAG: hypothetical protein OXI22_09895 [Defluviicoccus sp.]|nr:hypothetical protein [Defluviicoccus sp.]MDE0384185.1 hypothetical protein [Defluviicoccus sp.]
MCIIVDASVLGKFLAEPPGADALPIHKWLTRRRGKLVYSTGGKFAEEIVGKARERLLVYVRADMAVVEAREHELHEQEQALAADIRSNDPHVLALARVSGARLLYTEDGDLMTDFKDKRFVDRPRGKVYSRAANENLLRTANCAPRQP